LKLHISLLSCHLKSCSIHDFEDKEKLKFLPLFNWPCRP
jgi:hypothetical protein